MIGTTKILHLPYYYSNLRKGGGEAVVKKLFEHNSNAIDILFPKSGHSTDGKPLQKNSHLHKLIKNFSILASFYYMFSICKIAAQIRKDIRHYDQIVCHTFTFAAAIALFYRNKQLCYAYHGQGCYYAFCTDLMGYRKSKILKCVLGYFEEFILNSSSKVVFPSSGAVVEFRKSGGHLNSKTEKKIKIIYNGISVSESDLDESRGGEHLRLITVATMNPAKGIDQIPEFLSQLEKRNISYHWKMIGTGKEVVTLKNNLLNFNIPPSHVTIEQNSMEHTDILSEMKKSDYYLILQRISIFDLATLEALSCGCKAILSPTGGNVDLNNIMPEHVYLYDKCFFRFNELHQVWDPAQIRSAVSQKFAINAMYENYLDVFR